MFYALVVMFSGFFLACTVLCTLAHVFIFCFVSTYFRHAYLVQLISDELVGFHSLLHYDQFCAIVRLVMVAEVCHDWCSPIFSLYIVYHYGLWLDCFRRGVFDNLEEYIRW
jgi:hypothetical protein